MNSLPVGYEKLVKKKNYMKLAQLKEGDNKIRLVMQPIAGWLEWIEKKPMRYPIDLKPKKAYDKEKPPKPFWATYVWDYEKEDLFVLEITQEGVRNTLIEFARDPDIGDILSYDIKIIKKGTGQTSSYQVLPMPPKPLSDKIKEAMENSPVRLEALFEGGDPWNDLEPLEVHKLTGQPMDAISVPSKEEIEALHEGIDPMKRLSDLMEEGGLDTSLIFPYMDYLAEQKGQSVEDLLKVALEPKNHEMIKKAYAKYLSKNQ
jgi:hypothetical protein